MGHYARRPPRIVGVSIAFALILLLSAPAAVVEVVAPPSGGACSAGIITSVGSDIIITNANVNMTITSQRTPLDCFIHNIELEGGFDLTNIGNENASILLLYRPSWGISSCMVLNSSMFESCIDGTPLVYETQTLNNITHPRNLPSEFNDRFPDWVWYHEHLWDSLVKFTMTNLSIGSHENLILYFSDSIIVTSLYVDYLELGYGFSSAQLRSDSTSVSMRVRVTDGSQFLNTTFFPEASLVSSQVGTEYIGTWSVQYPYPPELMSGNTPEPIRAGFTAYLKISEYHLPTVESTTSSTSIISTTGVQIAPQTIGFMLIVTSMIGLAVIAHIILGRTKGTPVSGNP